MVDALHRYRDAIGEQWASQAQLRSEKQSWTLQEVAQHENWALALRSLLGQVAYLTCPSLVALLRGRYKRRPRPEGHGVWREAS